jgi:CIC family chloride channel protein
LSTIVPTQSRAERGDSVDLEERRILWQRVRKNPFFHFLLAIFFGIIAGLGAVVFSRLIGRMHNLFF